MRLLRTSTIHSVFGVLSAKIPVLAARHPEEPPLGAILAAAPGLPQVDHSDLGVLRAELLQLAAVVPAVSRASHATGVETTPLSHVDHPDFGVAGAELSRPASSHAEERPLGASWLATYLAAGIDHPLPCMLVADLQHVRVGHTEPDRKSARVQGNQKCDKFVRSDARVRVVKSTPEEGKVENGPKSLL